MPTEGVSSWLAIAAVALAFLVFDLWVVYGGASPGMVPGALTAEAAVTLGGGTTRRFAPGRMAEGTVIACVSDGLRIKARVPARGRSVETHMDAAYTGGATIHIGTLVDGSVVARCTR